MCYICVLSRLFRIFLFFYWNNFVFVFCLLQWHSFTVVVRRFLFCVYVCAHINKNHDACKFVICPLVIYIIVFHVNHWLAHGDNLFPCICSWFHFFFIVAVVYLSILSSCKWVWNHVVHEPVVSPSTFRNDCNLST